jgi:hypothetical protein
MTDFRTPRRGLRRARARAVPVLLAGMIAAFVLGPASAASASLGSVPEQVAAYVADGGMLARLSDVYGKNAAGAGIDFDATTKAGPISRVYEWTAARLSSPTTDHPVQLTNNWVVPITIADKPIGLATLWINPQTVAPELADFSATPALATAMAAVPVSSALVRDTSSHAWLALADGTVTPLVAGTSGVSKPTPVGSVKLSEATAPATAPAGSNAGLGLAIGAVGIVVVVIVVALLLPRRRPRRAPVVTGGTVAAAQRVDTVEPDVASPAAPEPVAVDAEPVGVDPNPRPTPTPRPNPNPKPRSPRPAPTGGSPVTKPVGSKPGSRTPSAAAASTKPRVQKPPVQKPPVQKPPSGKPPSGKPPSPRPPSRKPPTTPPSSPGEE